MVIFPQAPAGMSAGVGIVTRGGLVTPNWRWWNELKKRRAKNGSEEESSEEEGRPQEGRPQEKESREEEEIVRLFFVTEGLRRQRSACCAS